ncbi:MAG: hypothetical protein VR73_03760 [Gammaproteobacteria bacterium BRH_c0]|nr:MAG: hypothetical protein VR73_03760 [Gammaproteobacteria bacterium BRH_c0]
MNGLALVAEAGAVGLSLSLVNGKIAWTSRHPPPDNLLAKLAQNRDDVIAALTNQISSSALTPEDQCLVTSWLDHILENDVEIRQRVVQSCSANPKTLDWVAAQALCIGLTVIPSPEPIPLLPASTTPPSLLASLEDLPLLAEDGDFLLNILKGKPLPVRQRLLGGYREIWMTASIEEPIPHRQANTGRRAANTWIRQQSQGSVDGTHGYAG